MTKIQGAVIKEQDVTFAITVVKKHILNSQMQCQQAAQSLQPLFPGIPIVLMGQDIHGTPSYWGRKDIVNFIKNVHPSRIPWKEYTFN
ncbi:MAG TPA: hypothetical protein PKJ85_05805 [Nitrosomonas nitrosa]|nr:hypothetical protein [Nitrosomonas sp.]HNP51296.1 hypothetical protein [Nitrosomonas nitrosa]